MHAAEAVSSPLSPTAGWRRDRSSYKRSLVSSLLTGRIGSIPRGTGPPVAHHQPRSVGSLQSGLDVVHRADRDAD